MQNQRFARLEGDRRKCRIGVKPGALTGARSRHTLERGPSSILCRPSGKNGGVTPALTVGELERRSSKPAPAPARLPWRCAAENPKTQSPYSCDALCAEVVTTRSYEGDHPKGMGAGAATGNTPLTAPPQPQLQSWLARIRVCAISGCYEPLQGNNSFYTL